MYIPFKHAGIELMLVVLWHQLDSVLSEKKSQILEKIYVPTLPQEVTLPENVHLGWIYVMKYRNLILQVVSTDFVFKIRNQPTDQWLCFCKVYIIVNLLVCKYAIRY